MEAKKDRGGTGPRMTENLIKMAVLLIVGSLLSIMTFHDFHDSR